MGAEYVICWWSPDLGETWKIFDSRDEAEETLTKWAGMYPWNTYILAEIRIVKQATAAQIPNTCPNLFANVSDPPVGSTSDAL